ncbi:MAG: undecaprenyl-diphosphate phosphatase [Phycisphaerales bacterium]|nr:undecaprenyl-diphosphate phosphatase [Phycisphaerales bacterium]
MNLLEAVVLGLVEGITEYLPVSSTGHLILASRALGLDSDETIKRAVDDFNIVIQGGAILAVLGLYWPRILQMLRGLVAKDDDARRGRRLLINLVIAFIPAAILGFLFDETIEKHLFGVWPVIIALFVGGIWMIAIDSWRKKKFGPEHVADTGDTIDDITWQRAILIGLFQCVAMWPGTSRSMMTIAGGTILGLKPRQAAEFSFLLGLPTLGGACVYKLAKNLKHAHDTGTPNLFEQLGWLPVIVGVAVATVSAALAVRWLVSFLNKHGLAPFGYYRIALAIAVVALTLLSAK